MPQLIFSFILMLSSLFFLSACGLIEPRPESAEKIIERSSQQKIFLASYELVWKAAHAAIKYTIANENQDFGVIETDFIKTVDGWLPPNQTKPLHKSGRYKIILTFAKGKKKDSTRVTIEKKIEIFRDFISETEQVQSDGLEEQSIFYRIEREIIIAKALKKAASMLE